MRIVVMMVWEYGVEVELVKCGSQILCAIGMLWISVDLKKEYYLYQSKILYHE